MALRLSCYAALQQQSSQKAQRPLQVPAFGWCNRWWWSNSGKNRLCPEQRQEKRLACHHQHGHSYLSGRNHPYLWETLGYRGVFQNLQILSASGKGVPEPVLWCFDCSCIHCFCTIYDACSYTAVQYRWQNDLWTIFPSHGWTGWHHFQSINEDYHRCTNGCRYGIFPHHRTTAGEIDRQLCSETAKVHAKSIGVWFSGCLIAIL